MRCTRMVRGLLGVVALAAWLTGLAQAQQNYHVVADDRAGNETSEVSALKAEVAELRQQFNTSAQGPSDCAPACGGCGCGDCCQTCCNPGTCGCFEPCCHSTGVWATAEAIWFRYHRADGVRVGNAGAAENAEFDFEITPRLTFGFVRDDGLGARLRYWEFDHSAAAAEGGVSQISVDTYTFDFEVFDTFCLNRNWDLEIAAGIRYNEFFELMADGPGITDVRFNDFSGFGVLASAELRRLVGDSGALFVRARSAILMDDKDVFNLDDNGVVIVVQQVRLLDATVGMTELAFGYDYVVPQCDGSYVFARVQAEWQNWYNYSSSFQDVGPNVNNELFDGPSDVGFGGFGVAVGWVR